MKNIKIRRLNVAKFRSLRKIHWNERDYEEMKHSFFFFKDGPK